MKTLQSILNNPERRLSAEEMRDLKGGIEYPICRCSFHSDDYTHVVQGIVGYPSCHYAGIALRDYYQDTWNFIYCE